MELKKIVCFIDSFNTGGAQKQMVMLANGLSVYKEFEVQTLQYHDIDFFANQIDPNINRNKLIYKNKLRSIFEIIRFFSKEKPDVIISFLYGPNNYAALYKILCFWRKTNLIVGERNLNVGAFRIKDFIVRFSHLIANHIVCNSNAQKNKLQKYYSSKKLKFIANGTDYFGEYLKNISSETGEEKCVNLIVPARFINQKNPLGLIKAIKDLNNVNIYWYGEVFKNFEIYKLSVDFIKKNNIRNFHFMSPIKEIYKELIKYDALILPSFYEGCPNAIIDAMLVGLPVIASKVSDNEMYLEHQNQFLFDPNDTLDIESKILAFINSKPSEIKKIGLQNKDKSKVFFDPLIMTKSYIKLF